MLAWFDRMLGRVPAKPTGLQAKERLQLILVHDRLNLPPEQMEAMKAEILAVIAKYVTFDNEEVNIALQPRDRGSILVASVPFSKPATDIEKPGFVYDLMETESDDSSDPSADLAAREEYKPTQNDDDDKVLPD
jgi:cell division topological specificity factor